MSIQPSPKRLRETLPPNEPSNQKDGKHEKEFSPTHPSDTVWKGEYWSDGPDADVFRYWCECDFSMLKAVDQLERLIPKRTGWWAQIVEQEVKSTSWTILVATLKEAVQPVLVRNRLRAPRIYPPGPCIFSALAHTPLDRLRVIVIGQDPYIHLGQAMGLSFSVPPSTIPPPSLETIIREWSTDLERPRPESYGSLIPWASRGVLLWNTSLTVEAGDPGSHSYIGWQPFSQSILQGAIDYANAHLAALGFLAPNASSSSENAILPPSAPSAGTWKPSADRSATTLSSAPSLTASTTSAPSLTSAASTIFSETSTSPEASRDSKATFPSHPTRLAIWAWGDHARTVVASLKGLSDHLVLFASHPSPKSARSGACPFVGSRPFSKTNAFFASHGLPLLDWSL